MKRRQGKLSNSAPCSEGEPMPEKCFLCESPGVKAVSIPLDNGTRLPTWLCDEHLSMPRQQLETLLSKALITQGYSIIDFSPRHRGKLYRELPTAFLQWMIRSAEEVMPFDLERATLELRRRG